MTTLALKLSASSKTDFRLAATLRNLPRTDADELKLSVLFRTSAAIVRQGYDLFAEDGKKIDGVMVRASTPDLYTGYVSLNGLKNLIHDARVIRVEGPQPIHSIRQAP